MNQYNLILNSNIEAVYYGKHPKNVATKVFRNLVKKNINQSRICIQDNNTKKKFNYLAMTNDKLNKYNKLFNNKNLNQIGGSNQIDDKQFFKSLSELSQNINMSVDELIKILKTKYDPESEKMDESDVDNINQKLDSLNNKVEVIGYDVKNIKDVVVPTPNNDDSEDDDKGGFCTIL